MDRSLYKNCYVRVRLTELERQTFGKVSDMSKLVFSEWVRKTLREAAADVLERNGRRVPW